MIMNDKLKNMTVAELLECGAFTADDFSNRLINNTAAKISPIVEALGKDIWPCPHTGKTASSLAAILEAIFGHKKPFIKWEFEAMRGPFWGKNLNGYTL